MKKTYLFNVVVAIDTRSDMSHAIGKLAPKLQSTQEVKIKDLKYITCYNGLKIIEPSAEFKLMRKYQKELIEKRENGNGN